jgi:hypothetical protein
VPDRGPAQIKQGVDVHRHGIEPLLIAGIESVGRVKDAGIVDQDIQATQALDGGADEPLAGTRGAQVHRHELSTTARRFDGERNGAAALLVAA